MICLAGLGSLFAYEYLKGNLSPQLLGLGLLTLFACLLGFNFFRLKHSKSLPSHENDSVELARAFRTIRRMTVALPILLIVGLWATWDQPLFPKLVGVAINVLITCWLLTLLHRAKRKLR